MTGRPATTRRLPIKVVQPPQQIWPHGPAGPAEDVCGLDPDAFFDAITKRDLEPWDYDRVAAETGRSVRRVRRWTFLHPPNGRIGVSPWWSAGRARAALVAAGKMTRDGRAIPHKPTGRTAGAKDRQPRRRPELPDGAALLARFDELAAHHQAVGLALPIAEREARMDLAEETGRAARTIASAIRAARHAAVAS